MAAADRRTRAPASVRHPLEPLTLDELTRAIELVRAEGRLSERARFPTEADFKISFARRSS